MTALSKYTYYARSVIVLLTRLERPGRILGIFLGWPGALPAEVRLRREGWRFRVREAMDVWVIKETCIDRDYTRETALEADWRLVDIGAGLGDFTVYAAAHCPEGAVHAYEPLAASFELLEHNLALNGAGNARAFNLAVGAAGRVAAGGQQDGPAVSTVFAAADGQGGVEALTLDEVLDRLPGGRCDFLKIDCEGCEYDLLLGSSPETLARVQRISAETHELGDDQSAGEGRTAAVLAAFLTGNGFRVRLRPNPVHHHLGFLYAYRE